MSNIIDSIQLSGVTYTIQGSGAITVDSALDSGSTNPVENKALYNELRIPSEVESGLTLEWELYDGGATTNYPSGQCSNIIFEVAETGGTEGDEWYEPTNGFSFNSFFGDPLGYIGISINDGVVTVDSAQNLTYSISGNNVAVEYSSIAANVGHIYANNDNYWTTTAFVNVSAMIPLIDQVSANTESISGKQDTLSAGTGISISGNVISATGGGGNPTVELTQAQYDALVTAGTVSADTYYIITDASPQDMSNYWTSAQTQSAITQATSGKVDVTTFETALSGKADTSYVDQSVSGKQDTLVSGTNIKTINNESLLGSGNIDIQGGGGGKAVSGGTNISITTGETADTINCTLPFEKISNNSVTLGGYNNVNKGIYCYFGGHDNTINNYGSRHYIIGDNNKIGLTTSESNFYHTLTVGEYNINRGGVVFGRYNSSSSDALFSVGNGSTDLTRHNAFEIRQNGDIYITINGQDVKLQDILLQLSGTTS